MGIAEFLSMSIITRIPQIVQMPFPPVPPNLSRCGLNQKGVLDGVFIDGPQQITDLPRRSVVKNSIQVANQLSRFLEQLHLLAEEC